MLSDKKYQLLAKYRSPAPAPSDGKEMFQEFIDQKLVRGQAAKMENIAGIGPVCTTALWIVTQAGEDALSEFEEKRCKEAQEKRQQRFQNQVSVAQVLVPLITFLLGLLVEHFAGVIRALAVLLGDK